MIKNIYDLENDIDYEGSIDNALDFETINIDKYEVPEDLKETWYEMEDAYAEFVDLRNKVFDLIHDAKLNHNL